MRKTFGYALAGIFAAFIIGFLIEHKGASFPRLFTFMFLGFLALCMLGTIYLWLYYNMVLRTPMELVHAFTIGFLPFILGDLVKCLVAATIAYRVRGLLVK